MRSPFVCKLSGHWARHADPRQAARPLSVGYARVSTRRQRLSLQLRALRAVGCDIIYTDIAGGTSLERRGLCRALKHCRKGDLLSVWKLDRLTRTGAGAMAMVDTLQKSGVELRVIGGIANGISSGTAEGRMMLGVLGCIAEFERQMVIERTRAAVAVRAIRSIKRIFNELAGGRYPRFGRSNLTEGRQTVSGCSATASCDGS